MKRSLLFISSINQEHLASFLDAFLTLTFFSFILFLIMLHIVCKCILSLSLSRLKEEPFLIKLNKDDKF